MNTYIIQHRLHTLAQYYASKDNCITTSFDLDDAKFSHWSFNIVEGYRTQFWIIEDQVSAKNYIDAIAKFNKKISVIIAKMSLISQCYSEYLDQPYLIYKQGSDIAFFRYTKSSTGVPLGFGDDSLCALKDLHNRQDINSEFYYYWNDMINATGYSAKLLLMCSALEALVKSSINQKQKYEFLEDILGYELKDKIWGTNLGIRHRLIHGEYFSEEADKENYLQQIYEKVVGYFNDEIFKSSLIRNVKNPQRHPDGNKRGGNYWIKRTKKSPHFELKSLVNECDKDFAGGIGKFEIPAESDVDSSY